MPRPDKGKGPLFLGIGIEPEEPDMDMAGEAKLTAAKDAIRALKKADPEMLSDALERHYQACQGEGDEEEDEEEEA